jgi:hypothetical protein
MSALPAQLSISIASKLAHRSRDAFLRDVLPCVRTPAGRVDRIALEQHCGVRFTAEDYISADAKLTGQRRRQSDYRQRLRTRVGDRVF